MKVIKVKGMSCNHCVGAVTKALESIEGVQNVKVSLDNGEAAFDEEKPVEMSEVAEKIKKAGYEVE